MSIFYHNKAQITRDFDKKVKKKLGICEEGGWKTVCQKKWSGVQKYGVGRVVRDEDQQGGFACPFYVGGDARF